MFLMTDRYPLATHRSRYHRFTHRQTFQHLQACAAPHSQGHDEDGSLPDIGPDIRDLTRHHDVRTGKPTDLLRRAHADDIESGLWALPKDQREYLTRKVQRRVRVGPIAHQ